jgi:hypothetical protein
MKFPDLNGHFWYAVIAALLLAATVFLIFRVATE